MTMGMCLNGKPFKLWIPNQELPYTVKCLFDFTGLGLLVFLDTVHSYSAADEMVGLSLFDGSNDCYFHTGISPTILAIT